MASYEGLNNPYWYLWIYNHINGIKLKTGGRSCDFTSKGIKYVSVVDPAETGNRIRLITQFTNECFFESYYSEESLNHTLIYKKDPENGLWEFSSCVGGIERKKNPQDVSKWVIVTEDFGEIGESLTDEDLSNLVNTFLTGESSPDNENSLWVGLDCSNP